MKKNTPKAIVGKAKPNNINRSSLNKEVKSKCPVKGRINEEINIMKKKKISNPSSSDKEKNSPKENLLLFLRADALVLKKQVQELGLNDNNNNK